MLAFTELNEVQRRLQWRRVLSVFIDTAGTADGPPWRAKLDRALARLEATAPYPPSGECTARELCTAHLRTTLRGIQGTPKEPGWVAYVTTDGVVAAFPLDTRIETAVFWQTGIVITPVLETAKRPAMQLAPSRARFALQQLPEPRPLVTSARPG